MKKPLERVDDGIVALMLRNFSKVATADVRLRPVGDKGAGYPLCDVLLHAARRLGALAHANKTMIATRSTRPHRGT